MVGDVVESLVELTDHELDAHLRELELARRKIEAELAATIAVAEARQLNVVDGHQTMKGHLAATCNWAPGEISRFRLAATTIDRHPEVGDAWLAGRIGGAQVTAIDRVRRNRAGSERFGEFVASFVEHAEQLPLADLEVVLQRFVQLAEPHHDVEEHHAVEGRTATATDVGGELFLKASGGDATSVAEFLEILRRYEQREFERDLARRDAAIAAGDEVEPMRSGPQRRFDALMQIARSAAAHDGVGTPTEPLVSILIDHHTMGYVLAAAGLAATDTVTGQSIDPFTGLSVDDATDLLGDPADLLDRRCETSTGVPLRPADVLRALLSGHTRRVVLGAKGRVVDLGRASRLFTGAAREAATLLTSTCEHPGCDLPTAWCHVDHAAEWHELGRTDQDNAAIECAHHNRDKHRRRRRTRRAKNGRLSTYRADGTIILPVGCRPPRFDGEPDDTTEQTTICVHGRRRPELAQSVASTDRRTSLHFTRLHRAISTLLDPPSAFEN